jgi:hypothetical protein
MYNNINKTDFGFKNYIFLDTKINPVVLDTVFSLKKRDLSPIKRVYIHFYG